MSHHKFRPDPLTTNKSKVELSNHNKTITGTGGSWSHGRTIISRALPTMGKTRLGFKKLDDGSVSVGVVLNDSSFDSNEHIGTPSNEWGETFNHWNYGNKD